MTFAARITTNQLNGGNGFTYTGATDFDQVGYAVAMVDLNGDGFDDMVIGGHQVMQVIWGRSNAFPANLSAASLTGGVGFRLTGVGTGAVASAGDFNGDGFEDLLVGAHGNTSAGEAYLIYGSAQSFPDISDIASLGANRVVKFTGAPGDAAGWQVRGAGDVNGDGFDDVLIGAPKAGFADGGVYLVYGRAGAAGPISLAALTAQTGMRIEGGDPGDQMGDSISGIGDINGDGLGDLAVGSDNAFGPDRGTLFVVYGKRSGLPAVLDVMTLNGSTGFRIEGLESNDGLGYSVGPAGDLNADGIADLVVSATGDIKFSGNKTYVIFGSQAPRPAAFDLATLNGVNGFVIDAEAGGYGGASVGAGGDINGDGFDDLLLDDNFFLNPNVGGSAIVVFGKPGGFAAQIAVSTLNGVNGFVVDGGIEASGFGTSMAAGDINGDGLSDLLAGAPQIAWSPGDPPPVGHAYMLLGQAGGTSTAGADSFTGTAAIDGYNGLAGGDLMRGLGGNDVLRGGPGSDISAYAGAASSYEWWSRGDGTWRVKDLRAGSPEGTDILTDVESLQFSDKTVKILGLTTAEKLTDAYSNILRSTASGAELTFLNNLIGAVNGSTKTLGAAITEIVGKADQTTAVAAMSYQFFLNFVPSKGGFDYLVSPQGPNPNNINSAYYQSFNIENRYINFAVNLGKVGEGAPSFLAEYGGKTLFQATKDAYMEIFGGTVVDSKINTILDSSVGSMSRAQYFALYGGDGLTGIGTKAAMVGWLLTEAAKADLGMYANSSNAFLTDLADGAQTLVDVVGTYGKSDYVFNG